MKLIIKSIFMLSKEKLQVLSEELNFLYDICNYHAGDEKDSISLKKDLEDNFTNLKKQLIFLSDKTIAIDKKIEEHLRRTSEDERELLFFIDFYQKEINSIIKKLKLINEKTAQMFRDGYNQYIPKPTPGRMVSNINMTSQVEKSLHERLSSFLSHKQKIFSAQIIWQYTKSYKIDRDKEEKIIYFRMSYWYFDLPYLIPALTHEMSHLALEEDKEYEKKVEEISEKVLDRILNKDFKYLFKNQDIPIGFIAHQINEVLADVLSLIHHGNSYLFTMAHEFLGYYLSSTFYFDDKIKVINIAPWRFDDKRDGTFIRLSIMVFLVNFFKNAHRKTGCDKSLFHINKKNIIELKELLNLIYSKDNLKNSNLTIKDYYKGWHNYLKDFEELEEFILFFIEIIQNELKEEIKWIYDILNKTKSYNPIEKSKKINLLALKELNSLPKYYNDLWELRLKTLKEDSLIPHKYELRKKIHFNTIQELYQKKLIDLKNIQPFVLTFYKYKIDNNDDVIESNIIESEYESTLGIYDRIKIEEQKEFFYPSVSRIPQKKEEKEYHLKFSLIKIMNDIDGVCSPHPLNVLIQIELEKNLRNNNTYNNLVQSLEILYDFFNSHKKLFGRVKVFKSLGPKDIILRIERLSIEAIYEIKTFLAGKFSRTFSTISYFSNSNLSSICSTKEYGLLTALRLSSNVKQLELPFYFKDKIKNIDMITGVMDYRIYWKNDISIEDIENFYNSMIDRKIVSDIQTQFVKNKQLDSEGLFVEFKDK